MSIPYPDCAATMKGKSVRHYKATYNVIPFGTMGLPPIGCCSASHPIPYITLIL